MIRNRTILSQVSFSDGFWTKWAEVSLIIRPTTNRREKISRTSLGGGQSDNKTSFRSFITTYMIVLAVVFLQKILRLTFSNLNQEIVLYLYQLFESTCCRVTFPNLWSDLIWMMITLVAFRFSWHFNMIIFLKSLIFISANTWNYKNRRI